MNRVGYVCSIDDREIADHAANHDCPLRKFDSRGIGDLAAKAIRAATLGLITPCGSCKDRQLKLNKLMPFGKF